MIDSYKIGVAIAMSSNAGAVLGVLQHDLLGLQRTADLTKNSFTAMSIAARGAFAAVAGGAALAGMWGMVQAGSKLVQQQSLLRIAGAQNVEIAQATARAWETVAIVPGANVTQTLKMYGELRSQFTNLADPLNFLPDFSRLAVILENVTHKPAGNAIQTAMRAMDLRGQIFNPATHQVDPLKLKRELDMMVQAIITSHGLVTPQTFLNFQQQAGPAGSRMSPEAFYGFMPTAMQAMGGHRAGTSAAALFQQMIAGSMTQRTATEMQRYGLLDPSKVTVGRGGHITVAEGALKDFQTFMRNPFEWFNTTFREALNAKGKGDPEQLALVLSRLLGRQTSQREAHEFMNNAPQFQRDFDLRQQAMKSDDAVASQVQNSPELKMKAFTAAWENLITALGVPMVDTATNLMGKLTGVLTGMGQWAAANPQIVGVFEGVVAGLAALALIGGTLAVAGAALAVIAAPATGLVALVAGLSALSFVLMGVDWRGLATAVGDSLVQAKNAVVTGIAEIANAIIAWVQGLPGRVAGALAGALFPSAQASPAPGGTPSPAAPGTVRPGGLPWQDQNYVPQSYVPPRPTGGSTPIQNVLYLDGRQFARVMTHHQTQEATGPSRGMTGFDPRMAPVLVNA